MSLHRDPECSGNAPPAMFSIPALAQSLRMSAGRADFGIPRISARFLTSFPEPALYPVSQHNGSSWTKFLRRFSARVRESLCRAARLAMVHFSSVQLEAAAKVPGEHCLTWRARVRDVPSLRSSGVLVSSPPYSCMARLIWLCLRQSLVCY
jgi:hypothetical protein